VGAIALSAALGAAGCTTIKEHRGYIVDSALTNAIQPGIDNQRSVEGTLGRPTFTSQFGNPVWYYVSSTMVRKPFSRPKMQAHSVLAVAFDPAGNVVAAQRKGLEDVTFLSPEGDSTPTLGRERGFIQDLFGNIGQVGAGPMGGGAGQ